MTPEEQTKELQKLLQEMKSGNYHKGAQLECTRKALILLITKVIGDDQR